MGHDYRELESFVQQQQDAAFTALGDTPSPDTPPPSLYQRALGTGLSEVLASYRGAVLKLEQEILHQPDASMVLAKVHALLSEFMLVLPGLSQLLEHVRSRQLRGGALLRHLTDQCCTGTLPVQTCLKRLLWHCHQVRVCVCACMWRAAELDSSSRQHIPRGAERRLCTVHAPAPSSLEGVATGDGHPHQLSVFCCC